MGTSGLARHLVREGLLSDNDCSMIAKDYCNTGAAFAKVVVALGVFDENKLAQFIADHTKIPLLPLSGRCNPHPDAERIIDFPLLQSLEVIPLSISGKTLEVAMADPLDQATLQQLKFFVPYKIKPVIATFSMINRSLAEIVEDFQPKKTALQSFVSGHNAIRKIDMASVMPSTQVPFAVPTPKFSPPSAVTTPKTPQPKRQAPPIQQAEVEPEPTDNDLLSDTDDIALESLSDAVEMTETPVSEAKAAPTPAPKVEPLLPFDDDQQLKASEEFNFDDAFGAADDFAEVDQDLLGELSEIGQSTELDNEDQDQNETLEQNGNLASTADVDIFKKQELFDPGMEDFDSSEGREGSLDAASEDSAEQQELSSLDLWAEDDEVAQPSTSDSSSEENEAAASSLDLWAEDAEDDNNKPDTPINAESALSSLEAVDLEPDDHGISESDTAAVQTEDHSDLDLTGEQKNEQEEPIDSNSTIDTDSDYPTNSDEISSISTDLDSPTNSTAVSAAEDISEISDDDLFSVDETLEDEPSLAPPDMAPQAKEDSVDDGLDNLSTEPTMADDSHPSLGDEVDNLSAESATVDDLDQSSGDDLYENQNEELKNEQGAENNTHQTDDLERQSELSISSFNFAFNKLALAMNKKNATKVIDQALEKSEIQSCLIIEINEEQASQAIYKKPTSDDSQVDLSSLSIDHLKQDVWQVTNLESLQLKADNLNPNTNYTATLTSSKNSLILTLIEGNENFVNSQAWQKTASKLFNAAIKKLLR